MAKLSIFIILVLGIISTSSAKPLNEETGDLECVVWCTAQMFRPEECAIPALRGEGPCYECGPRNKIELKYLCDKRCKDLSNDASNCGVCGNQCSSLSTCCQGECSNNSGLQWAYYANPDKVANVGSGYTTFDPTPLKTINPEYANITTSMAVRGAGSAMIQIYGSPESLPPTYFALNHRGYLHALEGGTYTFTAQRSDEIVLYWIGPKAYSGWTRENADLEDAYGAPTHTQLITFTAELEEGKYYALRIVFANAQGAATENISVVTPNGTVILGADGVPNPYIVQYSCSANDAPAYPSFGQET